MTGNKSGHVGASSDVRTRAGKAVVERPIARSKVASGRASRSEEGLAGLAEATRGPVTQKRKVSLTLDADVVDALQTLPGPLSTTANDVLRVALAQRQLGELVEQLREESGPASAEARQRVLDAWLADR